MTKFRRNSSLSIELRTGEGLDDKSVKCLTAIFGLNLDFLTGNYEMANILTDNWEMATDIF